MSTQIFLGDCRDILAELDDSSVDSIVTDPPYELAFMGKKWDGTGIAFDVKMWGECLRVLKPGGHLLAFGGSRTWHRLTAAIEDAGFEIRDSIAWLYGSGFPKSLDVSKAIDKSAGAEREVVGIHRRHGGGSEVSGSMSGPLGNASELPLTAPATDAAKQWQGWGTALKPAFEPIVVARKPLAGTVAANVLEHGTGALNHRRLPDSGR
jgi:site-specific DNA-methyltransferase (adenine-specific)